METQQPKTEKKVKSFPKLVNPFHCKKPEIKGAKLNYDSHWQVGEMVKDEKTFSVYPKFIKTSWQEEIEANKDNCGMELMRKQLRQGLIKPEDLYDDGKNGIDTGLIPDNVHEARKKADDLNKSLADLAKELGLSEEDALTAKLLEEKLTAAVKAKYEAAQVEAQAKKEGEVQ